MEDQTPKDGSLPQVETQLNQEAIPGKKSKVWMHAGVSFFIFTLLGMISYISFIDSKRLKTEKYNATAQRLKESFTKPLTNFQFNIEKPSESLYPITLIPTPIASTTTIATKSGVMVASTGTADLLITNRYGKQIGYQNSKFIQQNPNEHIIIH